jgi:transcriptional regulator with XRE-family HTH domain
MQRMNLGKTLAAARRDRGLTLRQLEGKSGISNALISQIETGKVREPGFRTVVRLARVLRLPLKRLADIANVSGGGPTSL